MTKIAVLAFVFSALSQKSYAAPPPLTEITAKASEVTPFGESEFDGLVLTGGQVGGSSVVVLKLKNGSPNLFSYRNEEQYSFKLRLYDADKNPIEPREDDGGFYYCSYYSLSNPRRWKIKSGGDVSVQVDLNEIFKIPKGRSTEVYVSLWWYSFNSPGYSMPNMAIWNRLELR